MDIEVNKKEYHIDVKDILVKGAAYTTGLSVYAISKTVLDLCAEFSSPKLKPFAKFGSFILSAGLGFATGMDILSFGNKLDDKCNPIEQKTTEDKEDKEET